MYAKSQHIIQLQSIEINFHNIEEGIGVQNRIAEIFYERLKPRMEVLFDELADADQVITIEKLEIDCGELSAKYWEDEWVDNTLRNLRAELLTLAKKKIDNTSIVEKFFFFLEHGHLPWNCSIRSVEEFETEITLDHYFLDRLKQQMSESEVVTDRLMKQYSSSFLQKLVKAIVDYTPELKAQALYPVEQFSEISEKVFQDDILKLFAGKVKTKKNERDRSIEEKDVEVKKKLSGETTGEIYINNAGLIILHPFLTRLFESLDLTMNDQWINEESLQMAALITEFLVKGEEDFSEFNLPLNKILCGIDLEDTLEAYVTIDERIRSACEEMLVEVIRHWSSLKNTGIAGFRETFLQRSGKLTKLDSGWLLQVEQKGVDVLLGSIPWGIGTTRLPWMKEILFTEWA